MKKILKEAMMTSISEVMETMFFLPVEFDGEKTLSGCGLIKEKTLACRLTFNGDVSGSLAILAPKHLVAEIAENFMGEQQDHLTEEHVSGTLTEMLNMVCGNTLSKIDTKVPFDIGIPEVVAVSNISKKEIFTIVETTESKMAILLETD